MSQSTWMPKDNDVIIPIMGPTGVGKSTFINYIAGREVAEVGHDLCSRTIQLCPIIIDSSQSAPLNGGRLVLVDTPGFDDTCVDDTAILHSISLWLENMYHKKETKLAGIIYLHDISQARMQGSLKRNLDVFRKLCGDGALRHVVLCTTKWSQVEEEVGERRTEHLKGVFWKEMIEHGSTVLALNDQNVGLPADLAMSPENSCRFVSAWRVVNLIIESNREKMTALQIQKELVDDRKPIPDTEAGRELRFSLKTLIKILEETKADESLNASRRDEINALIGVVRDQIKAMRIPFSLRVLNFFNIASDKMLYIFSAENLILIFRQLLCSLGQEQWTPQDNDFIILVMGMSGAGKSEFINYIAGEARVTQVGDDYKPCTTKVLPLVIKPSLGNGRRLVLVDTPGYGDNVGNDAKIQNCIISGLKKLCKNEPNHAGIIYIHDISLTRIPVSGTKKVLDFVSKLQPNPRNVVLCTTKWTIPYNLGAEEQRAKQLDEYYWKDFIEKGSTVHKFENSQESAWKAVNLIIQAN